MPEAYIDWVVGRGGYMADELRFFTIFIIFITLYNFVLSPSS